LNPILFEILVIVSASFASSVAVAWLGEVLAGWPTTVTYIVTVMTVGPALAVLRGRDRKRDRLDLSERAAAELISLVILLALGWWMGRTFWA